MSSFSSRDILQKVLAAIESCTIINVDGEWIKDFNPDLMDEVEQDIKALIASLNISVLASIQHTRKPIGYVRLYEIEFLQKQAENEGVRAGGIWGKKLEDDNVPVFLSPPLSQYELLTDEEIQSEMAKIWPDPSEYCLTAIMDYTKAILAKIDSKTRRMIQ